VTHKDDFASELKKARRAANLSQAELGDRAGLTGSYLCMLESGRKPPPSTELVTALARALAIDEARLQDLAALERTPEPVRRRVMRLVRERGRVRRSRDAIIATTLFHMTRRPGFLPDLVADALGLPEDRRLIFGRLAHRVKDVPTAREAASRSSELLGDVPGRDRDALVRDLPSFLAQAPAGSGSAEPLPVIQPAPAEELEHSWRHVPVITSPPVGQGPPAPRDVVDHMHVDRRLWRPNAYLLVAADDEAYPRVERGDLLLVHPRGKPTDGAFVVLREGGRVRVRVMRLRGDEAVLESPRSDVPPIRMPLDRFHPLGTVPWIMRPLAGMPPPRRPGRTAAGADEEPGAG
jgi:transcriptional regulator with XRE-family HTH domain/SOS-response transcriptional repressor LexA